MLWGFIDSSDGYYKSKITDDMSKEKIIDLLKIDSIKY